MCWFQHRRSLENVAFHKKFAVVTDDHVFASVHCSGWLFGLFADKLISSLVG